MVDFKLTEDQKQYQDLAREFAKNEIAPVAGQFDHSGDFPESLCRKAWELGLMNLFIPEEYGGIGLSVFDGCVITEELARGCAAIACTINANNLALIPLLLAGTETQKQEFVSSLASEFGFASYCVQEDSNNAWSTQCSTEAQKSGDGFVITGKKIAVANARKAKWFLVIAQTGNSSDTNLSAFIVPNNLPGISISETPKTLGLRAHATNTVSFQGVKIPEGNLVGKIGQGWELLVCTRARIYPLIAAICVGVAKEALEFAAEYAKARQAFGQPIANHQAIRLMIADMAKDMEGSRLLALEAALLADLQSSARDNFMASAQQARIAKAFAQDTALAVATNAIQIYGGYGYSKEYPVEKLMRDAKCLQLIEGTSNHEQVTIAHEFAFAAN